MTQRPLIFEQSSNFTPLGADKRNTAKTTLCMKKGVIMG